MPLFDFACTACQQSFEALVRGSTPPACPACGSTALEKQMALPSIKTSSTHGPAMHAAKRRDAAQGKALAAGGNAVDAALTTAITTEGAGPGRHGSAEYRSRALMR